VLGPDQRPDRRPGDGSPAPHPLVHLDGRVTACLNVELPVITYAGAVTVDPRFGRPREAAILPAKWARGSTIDGG
jgi:hypothetical protein